MQRRFYRVDPQSVIAYRYVREDGVVMNRYEEGSALAAYGDTISACQLEDFLADVQNGVMIEVWA